MSQKIEVQTQDRKHFARVLVWPMEKDLTVTICRKRGSKRNSPKNSKASQEILASLRAMFPDFEMLGVLS